MLLLLIGPLEPTSVIKSTTDPVYVGPTTLFLRLLLSLLLMFDWRCGEPCVDRSVNLCGYSIHYNRR